MGNSGVNWYKIYYIFTAIHVLVGFVNNDGFRLWLMRFLVITIILAMIAVVDRNIS